MRMLLLKSEKIGIVIVFSLEFNNFFTSNRLLKVRNYNILNHLKVNNLDFT